MTTPIRPSLAQMLNPQPTQAAKPAAPPAQGSFSDAMAAQRAFFQNITAPKITPPTYTAADVARATAEPVNMAVSAPQTDANQPLRRPGSFLNIVV